MSGEHDKPYVLVPVVPVKVVPKNKKQRNGRKKSNVVAEPMDEFENLVNYTEMCKNNLFLLQGDLYHSGRLRIGRV